MAENLADGVDDAEDVEETDLRELPLMDADVVSDFEPRIVKDADAE